MESVCNRKKFPFTYDNIADINPNISYNIKEFQCVRFIAVKCSAHFIHFRSKSNFKGTLNYNFCLQSIYLVKEYKPKLIFTPAKRERDLND